MGTKYTIGVDFGTQSGRVLLVNVETGEELVTHVTPYRDGVIDEQLPGTNLKLDPDFALQNPDNYLDVLKNSIPEVLKKSEINPNDVIGIGIDFTSCTMLPVDKYLQPLCVDPKWRDNPHAWVKLWKHHAAQEEANQINRKAEQRRETWLKRYGGKISSEWMIAKSWQILDEAPEVYEAADLFMEATDWVIAQLTGEVKRNSCTAGYKSIWHKKDGYPTPDFFSALDPRLVNLTQTKLRGDVVALGTKAGNLKETIAKAIGLPPGIAVAVGNVDAHAAVPAMGVVTPGKMVMVMGTSTCHMVLSTVEKEVEGMCGVVEDGIIPGLFGYEAGQSAVGDIFEWYVENCAPNYIYEEAKQCGISVHELLEIKASALKPGESGILALDWHNGNRSVLVDTDLTGLMIGTTLLTKPEEMYRALIEATAFGTRKIIETFRNNGIAISQLYACGGLPQRNRMLMQIYADVTNLEISVSATPYTPGLGAAMFGAVAAGKKDGGYDSIIEAAGKMARLKEETFKPNPEHISIYDALYQEYEILHDLFGRTEDVMKRMKAIKEQANRKSLDYSTRTLIVN